MKTAAVVLEAPQQLVLSQLELEPAGEADVVVDIDFSGISTGTEKLLWSGRMPPFPGMGYPLVPGYESVGHVVAAGPAAKHRVGDAVFVPAHAASAPCAVCSVVPRRGSWCRTNGSTTSTPRWAKAPCCWRWPPPRTTRSRAAASATR